MSISAVDTQNFAADSDPHYEDRVNLAAVFRMTARLDMHESIANHFSYAVSNDASQFLINPRGRHFSNVRASELLLLDANDESTMDKPNAPDPSAWAIHGAMHRNVPQARCLLHVHSKYATVLASIEADGLPPIDQNTMRFFNRVSVDAGFDGMGLGDEAERLGASGLSFTARARKRSPRGAERAASGASEVKREETASSSDAESRAANKKGPTGKAGRAFRGLPEAP